MERVAGGARPDRERRGGDAQVRHLGPRLAPHGDPAVEISGVEIPEEARLLLLLASANRDEEQFDEPNVFDIHRENAGKHPAFSQGIHYCLGAPLARLEAYIAFDLLTTRRPDLCLTPGDQTIKFEPNISFRGPKELWVEWTPN